MKLPPLRSSPMQRLETPNPEVAAAPMRALGQIGQVIGNQVDEYLEDRQRKEAETEVMRGETDAKNALLEMHQSVSGPRISIDDEILKDIDYSDTDVITEDDGSQYIPSFKVTPQIVEKSQERIYAEQSARMTSDMASEEWQRRWDEMQRRSLEVGFKQTQKGLQTYTLGESLRTFDESMSLGNYDGAKEALFVAYKDGGLSEDRYRSLKLGVDKKEETDPINIHKAQNDVEAMQADIEMLKDPENKMALSWDEREAKVSELEGEISAYNRGQSAMEKGAMWQFSRNTAALTTAIDNGEKISAEQLASTKQMADELWNNPDLPDSTRTTIANFYAAYEYRDEIAEFKKVAPAEQAEFLRKANAKEMTTANIDLVNRLERVHEATLTALQTDSMTYMEDIGMAEVGPLDMQNLAQSLARRQVIYDKTMGNFGMASGYLKEHEAAAFAEMINTAGTDKVIHIAERVHQGLSENAVFFWEQLKQKNVGAIAVAGQKFAQGDQLAARDIVFGSKLRKDQSIVLQNERSDYDSPIKTELGTSYAFNHIENKYREDSIKDVYAALAWRQGDTSGEIDSSLLDEAIEIVTGGIFDINGVSITSPKKGVTEDRMEQWVDNMDPEFIDMHGGSANMPSEQIADELKGGSLQIIPASANSYFIRRKDTGTYLAAKDGSELEIPYDDSFLVASPRRRRGPQR